jgi:hypothetical protein
MASQTERMSMTMVLPIQFYGMDADMQCRRRWHHHGFIGNLFGFALA